MPTKDEVRDTIDKVHKILIDIGVALSHKETEPQGTAGLSMDDCIKLVEGVNITLEVLLETL